MFAKPKRARFSKKERKLLWLGCGLPLSFLGLGSLYEWNNRVPQITIPQSTLPVPNAFDFYKQDTQLYVPATSVSSGGAPIDLCLDDTDPRSTLLLSPRYKVRYTIANQQAFLRRNAPALKTLRRGFKLSYLQPPVRENKEVINDMLYGDLGRLLTVESHYHARQGKWDKAADSLVDIFRIGYQIPRGAPVGTALRGRALHNLALKEFKFVLPHLSAHKAKILANQLQKWHKERVTMPQILEDEKRAMQSVILGLIKSRDFRSLYVSYLCGYGCNVTEEQLQNSLNSLPATLKMRLAWMNKTPILEEYTRCLDWQIAETRKPYPQRNQMWPYPDSSDDVQQMMHQSFIGTSREFVSTEARISLLIVMLGLHAYKMDKGRYAELLNQLMPTYLSQISTDPFSNNQPLRYSLKPVHYITRQWTELKPGLTLNPNQPGSATDFITKTTYAQFPFTLYSVGLNCLDDDGKPYEEANSNETNRYQLMHQWESAAKADIVAGINS